MSLRVNKDTGEIYLYGVVGDSWGEESFTALDVIEALGKLNGKRAIARINSPGGVADEGIAIYKALKRYGNGVDTIVDALAASAASVIALAGEKRITTEGSRWMIHRAITIDYGNATQLRKTADTLETYDKSLVEIYGKYMGGKTPEEIMSLLEAETWYNMDGAIEAGLSTGSEEATTAEPMVASWMKNPPEDLFKRATNKGRIAKIKARITKLAIK